MDLHITDGTVLVGLKITHDACFTNSSTLSSNFTGSPIIRLLPQHLPRTLFPIHCSRNRNSIHICNCLLLRFSHCCFLVVGHSLSNCLQWWYLGRCGVLTWQRLRCMQLQLLTCWSGMRCRRWCSLMGNILRGKMPCSIVSRKLAWSWCVNATVRADRTVSTWTTFRLGVWSWYPLHSRWWHTWLTTWCCRGIVCKWTMMRIEQHVDGRRKWMVCSKADSSSCAN